MMLLGDYITKALYLAVDSIPLQIVTIVIRESVSGALYNPIDPTIYEAIDQFINTSIDEVINGIIS